jgi:hypothetical protein
MSEKMTNTMIAKGMEIVISDRLWRTPVLERAPTSVPQTMQRVDVPLKRVPQRGQTEPVGGFAFVV